MFWVWGQYVILADIIASLARINKFIFCSENNKSILNGPCNTHKGACNIRTSLLYYIVLLWRVILL